MTEKNPPAADPRGAEAAELYSLELRRRTALKLLFGATVAGLAVDALPAFAAVGAPRFLHGVASGDPLTDRVIIWTRVTPPSLEDITVSWRVCRFPHMLSADAEGTAVASAAGDFTVKIDVTGLDPDRIYFYQFRVGQVRSPIGRTRTAPLQAKNLNFAVFSCSIFEKGFFNAYAAAAREENLTAVLHLGDYNYEYGLGEYTTPALATGAVTEPRSGQLLPPIETVALDAYRARKALYRSDPDLQRLHSLNPWIVIWDDHETTNDAWTDGAENHQASEGSFQARKEAAIQAYYEWMPIREPADGNRVDPATGNPTGMYRSFDFGSLARLIMLDSRLAGRNQQLTTTQMVGVYLGATPTGQFPLDLQANGQPRTLLGSAQEAWFDGQITSSTQTWQLVGNQTLLHYQIAADYQNSPVLTAVEKAQISGLLDALFGAGSGAQFAQLGALGGPNPASNDSWNGYPSARNRLYGSLAKAPNPIVLSGDSHNAWVANLKVPVSATAKAPIAVEFGGTSVSSPGLEEYFITTSPAKLAQVFVDSSRGKSRTDELIYADTARRGFMMINVRQDRVEAEFVFVNTITSKNFTTSKVRFTVNKGTKTVTQQIG